MAKRVVFYETYCNGMDGRNLEKIYTTKSKADALQFSKMANNKFRGVFCWEIEKLIFDYQEPLTTVTETIYKAEA